MDIDAKLIIRNIIVALVGIGLVVLVIVLLIKSVTGGGPKTPVNRVDVSKYTYTSSIATLLVDGPTNLDQEHYQVRISVSGSQNEIDVIRGYQGDVIKRKTYPNNVTAYTSFLQALQLLGFSKGTDAKTDYRGYCPTGSRYLYSFTNDQDELFQYWSTSCGGQGTFQGNPSDVRQLFRAQIARQDVGPLLSGTNVNF